MGAENGDNQTIFGVARKTARVLLDGKKNIEVNCSTWMLSETVFVLAPEDRKKDGLCTKLRIRQKPALPNLDLVCNKMV